MKSQPNLSLWFEGGRADLRPLSSQRRPAGWAKIRILISGICNTDLELLRGYYGFRGVPGHEFIGEVIETGASRAECRWMGRRVTGEINISCRSLGFAKLCDLCRRGWLRHCRRRNVLGIVNHPGAHAAFVWLPLANLHPVPKAISDESAVFIEPLAAACEILEQVKVDRSHRVAVLGDGKLGLLIGQVLASARPRELLLVGRHAENLALARSWGMSTHLSRGTSPRLPRRELDIVVDATGSSTGLQSAAAMLRPLGTLVMKSTVHDRVPVDTAPLVVDELTLVGSRCGPFDRAIKLLSSGRVRVEKMIRAGYPLRKAEEALDHAAAKGSLKVLLSR